MQGRTCLLPKRNKAQNGFSALCSLAINPAKEGTCWCLCLGFSFAFPIPGSICTPRARHNPRHQFGCFVRFGSSRQVRGPEGGPLVRGQADQPSGRPSKQAKPNLAKQTTKPTKQPTQRKNNTRQNQNKPSGGTAPIPCPQFSSGRPLHLAPNERAP